MSGEAEDILRPEQVLEMQNEIAEGVRENIAKARMVLAGTETWNANQVKLFGLLINKVVPDLHHSLIERRPPKKLSDMTREELEAIAFSTEGMKVVEHEPQSLISEGRELLKHMK